MASSKSEALLTDWEEGGLHSCAAPGGITEDTEEMNMYRRMQRVVCVCLFFS